MRAPFLFSVFIVLSANIFSQGLSFYKEIITMKIDRGYFHVTGIYYLRSDRKTSEVLVYPYPAGPLYGAVDSVSIHNLTSDKPVTPLKTDKLNTIFNIDFSHAGDQEIQIYYRQRIAGNRAEYILKSTIGWKKPLDHASYQLIVPSGIRISSFSIIPQDSIATDREVVYLWNKYHYMPSENLIFEYTNR